MYVMCSMAHTRVCVRAVRLRVCTLQETINQEEGAVAHVYIFLPRKKPHVYPSAGPGRE